MQKLSKTFEILGPVYFIKTACDNVTIETIKNYFSKASFQKSVREIFEFVAQDYIPISTLSALIKVLNENQQDKHSDDLLIIGLNYVIFCSTSTTSPC